MKAHNIEAIKTFIKTIRPDINVDGLFSGGTDMQQVVLLVSSLAFEAGRMFQHLNPTCGLGVVHPVKKWKPIDEMAKKLVEAGGIVEV